MSKLTNDQFVEAVRKFRDEPDKLLVVYSVLYCPCIYESAHATMSLHRTKEGAVKAMMKLKSEELYQGFYRPDYISFGYGKKIVKE